MLAGDPVVVSLCQQQDGKSEVRHGQTDRPSYSLLSSLLSLCITQKCEAPYLPAHLPTSIRVVQQNFPMSSSITFLV